MGLSLGVYYKALREKRQSFYSYENSPQGYCFHRLKNIYFHTPSLSCEAMAGNRFW